MITCTENCKYQKDGQCTYEAIFSKTFSASNSNCAYFEQE